MESFKYVNLNVDATEIVKRAKFVISPLELVSFIARHKIRIAATVINVIPSINRVDPFVQDMKIVNRWV